MTKMEGEPLQALPLYIQGDVIPMVPIPVLWAMGLMVVSLCAAIGWNHLTVHRRLDKLFKLVKEAKSAAVTPHLTYATDIATVNSRTSQTASSLKHVVDQNTSAQKRIESVEKELRELFKLMQSVKSDVHDIDERTLKLFTQHKEISDLIKARDTEFLEWLEKRLEPATKKKKGKHTRRHRDQDNFDQHGQEWE